MHKKGLIYPISTLILLLAIFSGCSRKTQRTDAEVASDVQAKINSDSAIQSRQIGVQAENGIVTLNGTVASDTERASAAGDAATVAGVRTVVNNLQVEEPQTAQAPALPPPPQPEPVRTAKQRPPAAKKHHHVASLPPPPSADNALASATPAPPPATPAVQAPPPPPPPPQKVTIPAGTQLTIRLNDPLDSEKNQVGDSFHASLSAPIVMNAETILPSGSEVVGRVANVKSAGRFAGNSVLTLELTSISINGRTYNIQTNQWSRAGKGEGKNTAVKAGGGAALGAIIGGLAGGGKGAAIGSVAGAGAGTGVAATKKGEQIKLSPESTLNFQLVDSVTVIPQGSSDQNAGRTPLT